MDTRLVEIATRDAGRIRLNVAEAGEGPPVLMLHGWPQHHGCWRDVVPLLSDRFRLICPDTRGFGWSDTPGRGYDPETFAQDAIALLDALEIERSFLVGHDWGGYSGFLLALGHPERIERYLAINTPVPWARPSPRMLLDLWRSWYAAGLALGGEALLRRRPEFIAWILRYDAVQPGIDDARAREYAERVREPERARASMKLYRSYMGAFRDAVVPGRKETRRLRVPTRLLFGARDFFVGKALVEGWEPYADDMAVEWVEDSGHFVPEEKPQLVAERAAAFFGAVPAAAAR